MALSLGGITGAVNSFSTAFGKTKSLRDYLSTMSKYGYALKCRYEVSFSGISMISFFITDINIPSVKMNTLEINYDGNIVELPINYEHEHDFSMTVINDTKGYIYSTIRNFIVADSATALSDSGYQMTIKQLSDNGKDGAVITLNGVRFKRCGGLSFSSSTGEISTFDLDCSAISTDVGNASTSKIGGILGGIGSLVS